MAQHVCLREKDESLIDVIHDILEDVGSDLEPGHDIPGRMPSSVDPGETANPPEEIVKLLFERAELTEFVCQHPIDLEAHVLGRKEPEQRAIVRGAERVGGCTDVVFGVLSEQSF